MKLEFSRQLFEEYSDLKFNEIPSSGSRIFPSGRTGGQTDLLNPAVALRNFANALKKFWAEEKSSVAGTWYGGTL
jgi:hypothetical protein